MRDAMELWRRIGPGSMGKIGAVRHAMVTEPDRGAGALMDDHLQFGHFRVPIAAFVF